MPLLFGYRSNELGSLLRFVITFAQKEIAALIGRGLILNPDNIKVAGQYGYLCTLRTCFA